MNIDVLEEVLDRRYGCTPAEIVPIYEAADAAVYRVGRRLLVRACAPSRPAERVLGDAAVLRFLEGRAITAERVVPAGDGSLVSRADDWAVVVTGFVEGVPATRSETTLQVLGEQLRRLNALDSSGDPLVDRRAGSLPSEDLAYAREELRGLGSSVPRGRRREFDALHEALDATDDCEHLPTGIVHPDCHLGNVVVRPDGVPVLIDWTGAGRGPRIASFGVLLYSVGVASPRERPRDPNPAAVDALCAGFRPPEVLSTDELLALPDAIRFRPLVLAVREFAASVRRGEPATPHGWWSGYGWAEAIAARVLGTRR